MGKLSQSEEDRDWVMVNKDSSSDSFNSLENEVASISSGVESSNTGSTEWSECVRDVESALTMSNKSIKSGDLNHHRQANPTTDCSRHLTSSLQPEQVLYKTKTCQSAYVPKHVSPQVNSDNLSQQDPKLAVPHTNNSMMTLSDLHQLFPRLSKYQIEEWMEKDPRPHDMAFIGEGAYVSGARNYDDFLGESSLRVTTHQQQYAPRADTTEQKLGKSVDPDHPIYPDDKSR